jgi:hypothetical protein
VLRDKTAFKAAGGTLVVLVLARRVEFGILDGARANQWRAGSIGSLPIDSVPGISTLQALAPVLLGMPVCDKVERMRVLLADGWLAACSMPWSAALLRSGQAHAQARARLAQAGFALAPGDVIRVDDAAFGAPRLALGFPAELMGMLAAAAHRNAAQLASVLPLSAAGWVLAQRHRRPLAALALADTGMLVVARAMDQRARIQDITVRSGAGVTPQALWQRLCLRDPQLAALGEVALLDLSAGLAVSPSPPFVALAATVRSDDGATAGLRLAAGSRRLASALDAIIAPPAWTRLRAAVLAAAVLLACGAGWQALQATRSAHAMQAALDSVARPLAVPPRVLNWSAAELPRIAAVNAAIRELNLPFAAILRALEPAPDLKVAVLSVTTAPANASSQASTVKIVAEAPTRGDMARYAAFVAARKPFTGAWLTEHELDETSPERPYRFTLEATWSDQ